MSDQTIAEEAGQEECGCCGYAFEPTDILNRLYDDEPYHCIFCFETLTGSGDRNNFPGYPPGTGTIMKVVCAAANVLLRELRKKP